MLVKTLSLLLSVFCIPLIGQQAKPSENPCMGPPSQLQMNECAAFKYRQADVRLNKVYGRALQYMTEDQARAEKRGDMRQIEYEKTAIESLRQAERVWLNYRDLQCKAAGQQYQGGSIRPMIESDCLTTLTEHRIAELKTVYESPDTVLE
jgi:uncharacterized protein YecT (DUF1311 family)